MNRMVPNTLPAVKMMNSVGESNSHHASQYFLKNLISLVKVLSAKPKLHFYNETTK